MNIRSMVITGTVMLILFGGSQVFAQTNQPQQQGHWQMFVNNGGDGATAWKFNPERRKLLLPSDKLLRIAELCRATKLKTACGRSASSSMTRTTRTRTHNPRTPIRFWPWPPIKPGTLGISGQPAKACPHHVRKLPTPCPSRGHRCVYMWRDASTRVATT